MLDLSAAFETVDHIKLSQILKERFNFKGVSLKLNINYLKNRHFRVSINEYLSEKYHLEC